MNTRIDGKLVTVLYALTLAGVGLLAGCGGGATPVATSGPRVQSAPFYFLGDTTTGKVTALAPGDPRIPAVAGTVHAQLVGTSTGTGSPLQVKTSTLFNYAGNPGWYSVNTTVTNNLPQAVGGQPGGAATETDLIFTSLTFEGLPPIHPAATPLLGTLVTYFGGSVVNPDKYDPDSGLPILSFPGILAPKATSRARTLVFSMPKGATSVVWGVIVRTDSALPGGYPQPGAGCYVTTLAGSGAGGYADGAAHVAQFHNPAGLRVETNGAVLVVDGFNSLLREITPAGLVRTVPTPGVTLSGPLSVAVDPVNSTATSQIVYVGEWSSTSYIFRLIRDPATNITLSATAVAGEGSSATGHTGAALQLGVPYGLDCDLTGSLWVADDGQGYLYHLRPVGAGSRLATAAQYQVVQAVTGAVSSGGGLSPCDCAVDARGDVFAADGTKNVIVRRDADGTLTTLPGPPSGQVCSCAVNPAGTVCYYADFGNGLIYELQLGGSNPEVASSWVTTAPISGGRGYLDGAGNVAKFNCNSPGLALDPAGSLYVSDGNNNRVRRIDRLAGQ